MKESRARRIMGGLLVFLISLVLGLLAYIVTSQLAEADQTRDTLTALQRDREARIAARCEDDHRQTEADRAIVQLLRDLIAAATADDPEDARQFQEVAEAKIAAVEALVEQGDCITPNLPPRSEA